MVFRIKAYPNRYFEKHNVLVPISLPPSCTCMTLYIHVHNVILNLSIAFTLRPIKPQIALALLNIHEENLLECHNMETTCAFLKNKLPDIVLNKMPTIFEEAMRIDLGNRLATFETEFEVMSELSQNAFRSDIHVNDLDSVNGVLRRQNSALIEQLAICHGSIRRLEGMVAGLQEQLEDQKQSFAK